MLLYLIIFISKKEDMILNIISIVLDLIIIAMLLESIKKGEHMNSIKTFNFNNQAVRTVTINNDPYFIGKRAMM